jgi:hypothetical protein
MGLLKENLLIHSILNFYIILTQGLLNYFRVVISDLIYLFYSY